MKFTPFFAMFSQLSHKPYNSYTLGTQAKRVRFLHTMRKPANAWRGPCTTSKTRSIFLGTYGL